MTVGYVICEYFRYFAQSKASAKLLVFVVVISQFSNDFAGKDRNGGVAATQAERVSVRKIEAGTQVSAW